MTFVLQTGAMFPSEGCVLASRDAGGEISAVNVVRVFRSGYRKSWGEWLWELRVITRCLFSGTLPKVCTQRAHKKLNRYIEARTRYAYGIEGFPNSEKVSEQRLNHLPT